MSDIRQARKALARRILEGAGKVSPSERRAAFNNSGQICMATKRATATPSASPAH